MFEKRAYLLEVTNRMPTLRSFQALVDVLYRFRYNEFFLVVGDELPIPDEKKLVMYCQMQGIEFRKVPPSERDVVFVDGETIAVDTCAARSLAGRVEEMREKMESAERIGREKKLKRFAVTDFSDGYEWHPPCVSLPGIILGGSLAASGPKSSLMDVEKELDSILDAPLGGLLLRLGTLYLRGGAGKKDESEYFNILAGDCGYSRHPGLTQFVLDDVSAVARGVRIAADRWTDRSDYAREIVYAANLLECACHRRDESRLRALRDEHGHVWKLRFTPDGRVESLSKLPRF